jgi:nitrous oxide reductase accessory protein NosL
MKKSFLIIGLFLSVLLLTGGMLFAQEDIQKHKACGYCGMNRGEYAHSRMLIVYDDGTEAGTCSIHCSATDLGINLDKTPKSIFVGDLNTKKLIDAEQATWVIGGGKPGVMSKRAKWAFEKEADARDFIKTNGGNLATFDEAIKAAYEDTYADTKMIRDRRKMKRMQMQTPEKK